MVKILSLLLSRVLVAIIAGTLHPKPTSMGINDFPGRPKNCMNLSITKAALAIYPESSRNERPRNMKPIGGIKVAMVWMPPPMPSAMMVFIQSGAFSSDKRPLGRSTKIAPPKISKKSIKAPPMLITKRNMRYMAKRKTGMPRIRFKTILSILSESVSLTSLTREVVFFMRSDIDSYLAWAIRISSSSPCNLSISSFN